MAPEKRGTRSEEGGERRAGGGERGREQKLLYHSLVSFCRSLGALAQFHSSSCSAIVDHGRIDDINILQARSVDISVEPQCEGSSTKWLRLLHPFPEFFHVPVWLMPYPRGPYIDPCRRHWRGCGHV